MHDIPIAMAAKEIAIRLDMAIPPFLELLLQKPEANRTEKRIMRSPLVLQKRAFTLELIVVSIVLSRCALHHKKTLRLCRASQKERFLRHYRTRALGDKKKKGCHRE
jgi:hypothetical protein